jgi:hypothetical protein
MNRKGKRRDKVSLKDKDCLTTNEVAVKAVSFNSITAVAIIEIPQYEMISHIDISNLCRKRLINKQFLFPVRRGGDCIVPALFSN